MEVRGTCKNDLQCLCAQLAKESPFARRLNSQARQASADRAWFAISRCYDHCQNHKPGKKGYPRFQHDTRSVEYKQTGWKLEPDGRHLTFTDGSYVQFGVQAERRIEHAATGKQVGIDMGWQAFLTDSQGNAVANPRLISRADCLRTPPATHPREQPQAGEVHQRCRLGTLPRVADLLRTHA